ncbi:thiamine pyrophosphate-binding protein [Tumebacillus sp. ITR2]|uniref:Thiamine pyrophosphate-binding protein n=1 Tax=Tumebacillus amylolyticus TaxID=2801339 RepID=A0ABS1JD05_9BACL|nr:thiamine pyrophosphate-binding protein [Tumebacillus amylolyticus]MBL0387508.1 thiamine pyrophosphate-binding protein [Tumebacillus amylolyticus]
MGILVSELVKNFKDWGITHVFGIPGKPIVPLLGELEDQGIRFVLSRHEAGAGFAAAGYAFRKKTVGVAIGTSGPGGTNMLTAAAQAKAYNLPVLFITGHSSMKAVGTAHGQDSSAFGTDLERLFESVTLFSARVERADLLPVYLMHAIHKATVGARGPVHLSIPYDVFYEKIEPFTVEIPTEVPQMISSNAEKVVDLLNQAKKPLLFVGKGVVASEAYDEVIELAERWHVPVMSTPGGKGVFPTHHPLCLGGFGLGGTEEATEYLKSGVDLMLVVGTKLSDMSLAGFTTDMYPKQVAHFDIDITMVGRSLQVPTLAVQGDAKQNLRRVLELPNSVELPVRDYSAFREIAASVVTDSDSSDSVKALIETSSVEAVEEEEGSGMISATETVRAMRRALPSNALLFGDDGSHTFYAIANYDILEPGTFFFDDVFGAMGHAIGYAVGAKLAEPDRPVVCLTGDGCMFMHGTEIAMAVQEKSPVIFVCLNNGRLDMVEKGMSRMIGSATGSVYEDVLKVKEFAEAMGATAHCCHTIEDVEQAIALALENTKGPTVIEVLVDPFETPPTMKRAL